MSGRRTCDYTTVLAEVRRLLPSEPRVEEIVMDFEKAMWWAVISTFPDTTLQGCAFHWTQAIWGKAQELEIARAYLQDEDVHRYIKKLLALPFIPDTKIQPPFDRLTKQNDGEWKETSQPSSSS